MSENEKNKKPAAPPAPPQDAGRRSSKSYDELMHGFEEIRKIQTNQEVFEKRGRTDSSIEKIKKNLNDQKTPDA